MLEQCWVYISLSLTLIKAGTYQVVFLSVTETAAKFSKHFGQTSIFHYLSLHQAQTSALIYFPLPGMSA